MRLKQKSNFTIFLPICVTILMLIIGFFIGHKIQQYVLRKHNQYDTAVKIESEELFRKAMHNDIGLAFIYGNLKPVDPVSVPEISGEYFYIKKVKQKYQRHTKKVYETYKDSNGKKHTRTKKKHYYRLNHTHNLKC